MPGARPQRDPSTRLASSQTRGARVAPGSVGVARVASKPVQSPGDDRQEVFVEPYDEAVSFARGYPHWTFDPDGVYTA